MRRAFVVVGMAYGDEGKGSVVDWLVREYDAALVVRFNGGAQAAHHVVAPDGREHTFSQFGSGTLAGARTYLSEYVLVNPLKLATEAVELMELGVSEPFARVMVHPDAPVTTPYHVALNRLRELSRGDSRHGSCGLGIGETMVDVLSQRALRFGEIGRRGWLAKLMDIRMRLLHAAVQLSKPSPIYMDVLSAWEREWQVLRDPRQLEPVIDGFETVARAVRTSVGLQVETAVFEGAQGVLLDENWGFAPYNTWSTTTSRNALVILRGVNVDTTVLGVIRAYLTRHGRGPLPTEDPTAGSGEASNPYNPWQEDLRFGWPDLVTTRYATLADGHLDGLVVTCMDRLAGMGVRVCYGHGARDLLDYLPEERTAVLESAQPEYRDHPIWEVPAVLAAAAGVPLWAVSHGPTATSKQRMDARAERLVRTPPMVLR